MRGWQRARLSTSGARRRAARLRKGHYHHGPCRTSRCLPRGGRPRPRYPGRRDRGFLARRRPRSLAQAPSRPEIVKAGLIRTARRRERIARPRKPANAGCSVSSRRRRRSGASLQRAGVQRARHIRDFDRCAHREGGSTSATRLDYYASCSPGRHGEPRSLIIHATTIPGCRRHRWPPFAGHPRRRTCRIPWYVGAAAHFAQSPRIVPSRPQAGLR